MELLTQANITKGVYWHVFPTYTEGKDAVWRDPQMLFNIVPQEMIEKKNDSELIVYLRNGSLYQIKGADNPDSLRGAGPKGVVLDEFDTMKIEAWRIIEPILRANDGWAWFVGTPKGKKHLFEMYQRGQTNNKEWKSWRLKASESGIISPDQLEESRKTSLQSTWNQEYECEFLEGEGSVFRGVREVMTSDPQKPMSGHYYVMGVDLAKVQDFTAITVYDRSTNEQVYQKRIQKIEWPFQKKWIKEVCNHYNRALISIDATGIGDPIADDLLRDNMPVEPYKITSESKKELIEKLSIWIEQKKIKMLNLEETSFEFDNFSYEVGPTGKIRYQAREGFHDDIVIAHALTIWLLQPLLVTQMPKEPTLVQQHLKSALKGYDQNEIVEI
jgi:hypothetical protein